VGCINTSHTSGKVYAPLLYDKVHSYLIAAGDVVHDFNSSTAVSLVARQLVTDGPVRHCAIGTVTSLHSVD